MLDRPEQLAIELPLEVSGLAWDVILLDGPRGHKYAEEIPGRMSRIYTTSTLVGQEGFVFVHDAQRTVEKTYAQRFLGKEHFIEKVSGRALLRLQEFSTRFKCSRIHFHKIILHSNFLCSPEEIFPIDNSLT